MVVAKFAVLLMPLPLTLTSIYHKARSEHGKVTVLKTGYGFVFHTLGIITWTQYLDVRPSAVV